MRSSAMEPSHAKFPLTAPQRGLKLAKDKVMARKKKAGTFSAVKAVKANARERLGTPPPSAPIPDRRSKAEHGPEKHKRSLQEIIAKAKHGEET